MQLYTRPEQDMLKNLMNNFPNMMSINTKTDIVWICVNEWIL